MSEAHDQVHALACASPRSSWLPTDVIVQAANGLLLVTLLVFAARVANVAIYLALHALLAAIFVALVRSDCAARRCEDSRAAALLRFLHYWLPAIFLLVTYFEAGLLIPQIHPFDDHRIDRALQAVDVWLLGDPSGFIAGLASPMLSDLLTICYWGYYVFPLALPAVLYARGTLREFQRVVAIILIAFLLSYAGYFAFPAIGPHRLFDGQRIVALEGYGLAGRAYTILRVLPIEPPDAFPSGHALIGVLVPALAWRTSRPLFLVLCPLGLGIVLATIYLRFHYVADVLAAFALAPIAWKLGSSIDRRWASAARTLHGRCAACGSRPRCLRYGQRLSNLRSVAQGRRTCRDPVRRSSARGSLG
jgi:membrane-associated phospholipid phosphatase